MTEQEWMACTDTKKMVEYLREVVSDRKLRLFACACCRLIWHLFTETASRKAVETSEQFADGLVSKWKLKKARIAAHDVAYDFAGSGKQARLTLMAWEVAQERLTDKHLELAESDKEQTVVCLHDLFGNPFRPIPIAPAILTWHDGTVVRLAQAIYEERQLPAGTFDSVRMNILADALLDAGCDNEEIIQHCRSNRNHMRGCWVVDLLLGKS